MSTCETYEMKKNGEAFIERQAKFSENVPGLANLITNPRGETNGNPIMRAESAIHLTDK